MNNVNLAGLTLWTPNMNVFRGAFVGHHELVIAPQLSVTCLQCTLFHHLHTTLQILDGGEVHETCVL